jgi:hypothetical protein
VLKMMSPGETGIIVFLPAGKTPHAPHHHPNSEWRDRPW